MPTGIITNYHIAYTKEVLVKIFTINSRKDAVKLVGHKVKFKDMKGNTYIGVVSGAHGTTGMLKVRFKKRLPPYCLAKPVEIE